MGHLLSRAFKRITQCSQSRCPAQQQQQQESADSSQERKGSQQDSQPVAQIIPVGQSIDSSDYALFNSSQTAHVSETREPISKQRENEVSVEELSSKEQPKETENVEEAVIKIQALVRGHLTRKALKGTQQHSVPPPNALGQSQFDLESLTKTPPSAIFSSILTRNSQQQDTSPTEGFQMPNTKSPLESIAEELASSGTNQQIAEPMSADIDTNPYSNPKRISPLTTRSASSPSQVQLPTESHRGSVSPAISEAAKSIELNCDTPTSVSIDILDHNAKPTDRIASVLHPKHESQSSQISDEMLTMVKEESLANGIASTGDSPLVPGSSESEEAAAIRIQSAFRGYRSRKNSPYRTRSPNSPNANSSVSAEPMQNGNKRPELRSQEATDMIDDLEAERAGAESAQEAGRRQSRTRQRDISSQELNDETDRLQNAPSIEEFTTTTEEDTVKEVTGKTGPETRGCLDDESQSSLAAVSELVNKTESLAVTIDSELISSQSAALVQESDQQQSSIGAKSDNSVELDTDSSILGAVSSFNEDAPAIDAVDERSPERSIDASLLTESELEAQAQKLVEEITSTKRISLGSDECALDESITTESILPVSSDTCDIQDSSAALVSSPIDEEEQRAIELESDDIERRDPRGQASEERAKSPLIKTEAPEYPIEQVGVEPETDRPTSGQSSPGMNSSGCGSSEEGDEEEEEEEEENHEADNEMVLPIDSTGSQEAQKQQKQPTHQQQQQQQKSKPKNKKNNRNKRKNHKK